MCYPGGISPTMAIVNLAVRSVRVFLMARPETGVLNGNRCVWMILRVESLCLIVIAQKFHLAIWISCRLVNGMWLSKWREAQVRVCLPARS